MPVRVTVDRADGPLPAFDFHWDTETEILAGRHSAPARKGASAVAWELEGQDGAVVVLETVDGVLCGVEVVVWPDVERAARLASPHDAVPGRVRLVPPAGASGAVVEVETRITAAALPSEVLIHLSLGAPRARSVQIASNVVVDLDAEDGLAGLWLQDLPLFPQGG
jgi:hypothetical protein